MTYRFTGSRMIMLSFSMRRVEGGIQPNPSTPASAARVNLVGIVASLAGDDDVAASKASRCHGRPLKGRSPIPRRARPPTLEVVKKIDSKPARKSLSSFILSMSTEPTMPLHPMKPILSMHDSSLQESFFLCLQLKRTFSRSTLIIIPHSGFATTQKNRRM